jgi:hypothetical protein
MDLIEAIKQTVQMEIRPNTEGVKYLTKGVKYALDSIK